MTEDTTIQHNDSPVANACRTVAERLRDSGNRRAVPMPTDDARTVIESMLVENTGTHFLDSGGAYGRNWQENQKTPPWEKPEYQIHGDHTTDGYIIKNVFHFMRETLERDDEAMALEAAYYAYAFDAERKRDAHLTCMKSFPEWVGDGRYSDFIDYGLPVEIAEILAGVGYDHHTSWNTYNHEFGSLSQVLQGVTVNWETRDAGPQYSLVQVHQGCDVRGGYTHPRVFKHEWVQLPIPHEAEFHCENCGWYKYESCVYGDDSMTYHESRNEIRCSECGNAVSFYI